MDDPTIPGWVLISATFVGGTIAAFVTRMGWKAGESPKSAAAKSDAMIAAVGLGFGGSAEQTERLIQAVNGVSAAIRDKKQDDMQETMNDLLEELRKREGR